MLNPEACADKESFWRPTELVSTLLSRSARDTVWHWISQKQFLGDDNQPRPLSLCASEKPGFNCLTRQVNLHAAPSAIYNELLRKGIVEQIDEDCLLLRRSAYVPGRLSLE